MHLIETYALTCGLKIDKPYVYEHYTPIIGEKFVTFNKKVYPYYQEVIALIQPKLDKQGITVIQLRTTQENVEHSSHIVDNLSFGQWAYIMKHSLLHFGEDDFLFDLAGHYDIPRVILFSNTYPETTKPYWGSPEKQRILSTTGPHSKPSLTLDPALNFVRFIKPEDIAAKIMELLGIAWTAPYETIYAGKQYRPQHDIIELIPDETRPVVLNGPHINIGLRMDYKFAEGFLISVLEQARASIVTNKPININILQGLRNNISEIIYIVDAESDIQFVRSLGKLNLTYAVLCYKHDPALKEKFFEVCTINNIITADLSKTPGLEKGLKGLAYKSAKRIIHGDQEFKDKFEWVSQQPSKASEFSPCPENPSEDFLRELEFLFIVKPKS